MKATLIFAAGTVTFGLLMTLVDWAAHSPWRTLGVILAVIPMLGLVVNYSRNGVAGPGGM
jgi:hypothetical protein